MINKLLIQAGWLDRLTGWFRDALLALFQAFKNLLTDLILKTIQTVFEGMDAIIASIPAPDFLYNYSMCGLLSGAGPTIGWVYQQLHISECMSILAAGILFRMVRKVFTLFQW